jgi:sugar (pentulose or hexulose) kinase
MSRTGGRRAIGIDVGTSGLKAVLVHVDDHVEVERSTAVGYDPTGAPTRDPDVWVAAARTAIDQLANERRVDVIGLTGQMHALVPVRGGRPFHEAMLWLDYEGAGALERFCKSHTELPLLARTGNIPLPDFTLAKWLMLVEQEPLLARAVERLPAAKDFVRSNLCESAEPVTDLNEAAGTQWFDPFRSRWDMDITQAAALPPSALVPVVRPEHVVGVTRLHASGEPIPVVAGTGDQHAAARALGADVQGKASLSLGTSGVLGVSTRLIGLPDGWDGSLHLFPIGAPGAFHIIATVPAFGSALRWIASILGIEMAELSHLAATGRADAARFYPYLNGSGAPHPDASRRGEFRGLAEDSTRADLARAVVDGLANEVACLIADVRDRGIVIADLVVSGGPTALAPLLGAIAGRLDVPVWRSVVPEASAVGAALLGIDGLGWPGHPTCDLEPVATRDRTSPSPRWLAERAAILNPIT